MLRKSTYKHLENYSPVLVGHYGLYAWPTLLNLLVSTGIPPTSNPPGSRTTDWRHKKKTAATTWGSKSVSSTPAAAYGSAPSTSASSSTPSTSTKGTSSRKVYTCRICGKPMTSAGLTQYKGQRYCPDEPGQMSKDDWLALKRIEAKAKAARPPP